MRKDYRQTRTNWAQENAETLLTAIEKVGVGIGVQITPMQYVQAYKLCVEDYKFGYPSEYKLTELISTKETYEQTLAITTAIMKMFRLDYYKTIKKQTAKGGRI